MAARHVDHRDAEVRERELGIQSDGTCGRPQSRITPRRVTQTEQMPPVRRFQRHRPLGRCQRLGWLPCADQWQHQRCMGFGQPFIELYGMARMLDRALEQIAGRLIFESRGLYNANSALESPVYASA